MQHRKGATLNTIGVKYIASLRRCVILGFQIVKIIFNHEQLHQEILLR
jgi:hypothetical protein